MFFTKSITVPIGYQLEIYEGEEQLVIRNDGFQNDLGMPECHDVELSRESLIVFSRITDTDYMAEGRWERASHDFNMNVGVYSESLSREQIKHYINTFMKGMTFEGETLNDKLFEAQKHTALTTAITPNYTQYVECEGEDPREIYQWVIVFEENFALYTDHFICRGDGIL